MKSLLVKFFLIASCLLPASILALPTTALAACSSSQITLGAPIGTTKCLDNNSANGGVIFAYLRIIIAFLSGAVGLVVVMMLVIGGIRYITSAGDPGQIKAAKNQVTNALTGLVLFALMFAILNFLIPGHIIG